MVKLQALNLQFCRKNVLHCKYLLICLCMFYEPLLQNIPQRKRVTILKFTVCSYCYSFSAVKARSFEWLTDGKSLVKTKLNRLINSVCLRVRSITKKEKHGNYIVKIYSEMYSIWYLKVHSEEQNTWYMKVIWKI